MSVNIKDTKNAIYSAYQEAAKQAQRLEAQLKAKEKELEQALKKAQTSTSTETIRTETKIVVKAPELDTVEGIVSSLQSVQDGMNKAISQIASQQVVEAETLADLIRKIEEEKTQIKNLYNVEAGNGALQKLLDTYISEKEQFEESFQKAQKEQLEELDKKTKSWEKERAEQGLRIADRKIEYDKSQKRDADEYLYILQQSRALEDDAYAQKSKQLQEELDELKNQKQQELALREKEVAEKEKHFKEYKEKFDGLEERLSKEIKKAEGEAKGIVDREHRVRLNLYKKDVENTQKTLDLRIASLKETIEKQDAQLKKLNEQLIAAHQQAQVLAIKALEGTANTESLSAIREIAMEQAKNSNKNK